MNKTLPLLQTMDLAAGYLSGGKKILPIAGPLAVDIHAGQLICLLGPNGSGKSTLLRTLAGLQPPLKGSIILAGTDTHKLKPAQLAKKISLVLTDSVKNSNLTAYSLVALGRYPYSNWLGVLHEADKTIITQAIKAAQIETLLDRKVATLSDGESQKVMLARALAQDTPLMMLDEPTAHLDLPSRIQLMRLLHRLARQTNKGILVSTHELDLALQVADQVWLLQAGGQLSRGTPEDLVLNGTFERVFDKEGIFFDKTTGAFNMHADNSRPIALIGEGAAAFWTKRALQRQGFLVNPGELGRNVQGTEPAGNYPQPNDAITGSITGVPHQISIRIVNAGGSTRWLLEFHGGLQEYETIGELLTGLGRIKYG